ncbi:MAG TPA: hypothetical protein VK766_12105 [Cytophagaceae bacterium]|nr:hypothetical protein [Cytophagaceae bacterium]
MKWVLFIISNILLFLFTSCDSVNELRILNKNIDSIFVYGISRDIYKYRYNQNFDSIIHNNRVSILLKEKQIIIFGAAINDLELNEIPIDSLIIYTKTDTLYNLCGRNNIYEEFKKNKFFSEGYCLEVKR